MPTRTGVPGVDVGKLRLLAHTFSRRVVFVPSVQRDPDVDAALSGRLPPAYWP